MAKIATSAPKKETNGSSKRQPAARGDERQEIERLAYQYFVERGYEHGHDVEDWARAEAVVRSRRAESRS
jgi:hypothetical protein